MAKLQFRTISNRMVAALKVGKDTVFWDREFPGFGVRVHPSGSKVYMVHKRSGGKSRRVTIGRHGVWLLDAARREAGGIIASLKNGETPGRAGTENGSASGPTIAVLAEQYMAEHVAVRCKPTTARSCRHIFDKYLLPQFGRLRLGDITPDRLATLHYRLHQKPIMANQVIDVLSRLFNKAEASGYAPAGGNPCRFIKNYPTRSCERFLSEREFVRLGTVLDELEAKGKISATAAAGLRLLMLTGCRRNEILTLRWEDVDLEHDELRLRDGKRGPRMVPLTPPVQKVLDGIERIEGNPWVIRSRKPGACLPDLTYYWNRIQARAGLEGVRVHDLRHSCVSQPYSLAA